MKKHSYIFLVCFLFFGGCSIKTIQQPTPTQDTPTETVIKTGTPTTERIAKKVVVKQRDYLQTPTLKKKVIQEYIDGVYFNDDDPIYQQVKDQLVDCECGHMGCGCDLPKGYVGYYEIPEWHLKFRYQGTTSEDGILPEVFDPEQNIPFGLTGNMLIYREFISRDKIVSPSSLQEVLSPFEGAIGIRYYPRDNKDIETIMTHAAKEHIAYLIKKTQKDFKKSALEDPDSSYYSNSENLKKEIEEIKKNYSGYEETICNDVPLQEGTYPNGTICYYLRNEHIYYIFNKNKPYYYVFTRSRGGGPTTNPIPELQVFTDS